MIFLWCEGTLFPRVRCNGLPIEGLEVLQSHSQAANLLESIHFPDQPVRLVEAADLFDRVEPTQPVLGADLKALWGRWLDVFVAAFPCFQCSPTMPFRKPIPDHRLFECDFFFALSFLNCSSLSLTFLCLLPQFMTHHLCAFRLKSQCGSSILSNRREGICSSYLPIIQGMLWSLMINFLLVFNSIDWFATHSSINLGLLVIHELFFGVLNVLSWVLIQTVNSWLTSWWFWQPSCRLS